MSFLTAEWRKLAIANFGVDPDILKGYLPHNTELDFYEGVCYVSLVGFLFKNTRLMGIRIPMHVNFEEVNLRFYVRYKHADNWKRGVVFIRELVPRPALTFVAKTFYGEPYQTAPMSHSWNYHNDLLEVAYRWKIRELDQSITITANNKLVDITPGSKTEFITEHYWGYTKVNERRTFEYEVTHPKWQCYEVADYSIEVDFEQYGNDFATLTSSVPESVMLAEGSVITVENKREITSK